MRENMLSEIAEGVPGVYATEFERFVNELRETIREVHELNRTLSYAASGLRFYTEDRVSVANIPDDFVAGQEEESQSDLSQRNKPTQDNWRHTDNDLSVEPHSIFDFLKKANQLGENTIKVTEAFGELSPAIKNLKNAFGIIGNINEGAAGFAELISARDEYKTMAEHMATASQILAGVAGIAEAAAAFGPPGWITGAAILTAGGLMYAEADDSDREKKNAAMQEQVHRSMETFVMPEPAAKEYESGFQELSKQKQHNWHLPFDPVKENTRKYGAGAYDLNIPVPLAKADHILKPNLPPGIYSKDEDRIPVKQSYLERTFDLQQRLTYAGMMKGAKGFKETVIKEIAGAKEYDKLHHTNTLEFVNSTVSESFGFLLQKANNGRLVSDTRPGQPGRAGANGNSSTRSSRTININLNKSLIENFTINTKEVKEGIGDFKRKVEEVLLEILNSANVIQ